jgi:aryl-alcohol dehydrogenase-like predicted oxidoreductase
LRYRALGRTGLTVSEIGFGAWGIGGDAGGSVAYGPADRDESLRALRTALDRGITFYDTSDFYGHGRSEELIGEAFSGRRSAVVIASKAGLLRDGSQTDFSAAHLRRALEGSLKRLKTGYLDLFQLHSPPLDSIFQETIGSLERMKAEGLIRAYGISARSPEEAKTAIERFDFAAAQVNFNLLDARAIRCGLFELAERKGVGIVSRTPLSFGFLTGRYAANEEFHESDHRRRWTPEQRSLWAGAPERFAAVVAALPGQTAAQFALRYCLSYPCVSSTIPGMLTTVHVEENAAAGGLPPMKDAESKQIAGICEHVSFFAGNARS